MSNQSPTSGPAGGPFVSTGHLPEPDEIQQLIEQAYAQFRPGTDGQNSQV